MTAITDTRRKRSRDEDTCDFMPISKRINNLTLTSQSLGEQDTPNAHSSNITSHHHHPHFMAINDNQEIQSEHFAQHSMLNSYPNGMSSHHYQNGNGQAAPSNYHQSHLVQSTNHSNGFHNGSHLAIGTNAHAHKPNPVQQLQQQQQHHHHHHQQQQPQQPHDAEPNNNQMDDVYCPELKANENPFYYDKNKLLFDLHVERQRRHQSHH